MSSMDSLYGQYIAGKQYQIKKVIIDSEDTGIYICAKGPDNLLYTVNQYKTDGTKTRASDLCKDLNPAEHRSFHEMFLYESSLFVVFKYHNGIELKNYLSNSNPDIFERLNLGELIIDEAINISAYPPMIRVTAMQIENVVVLNDDAVGVNFYLDFSNAVHLITDTKYISSTGNVLYELFADVKNCPNQVDSFIVKAAFGRYDSLDRLALEYSAIKSEIIDFFMDVERPQIQSLKQKKSFFRSVGQNTDHTERTDKEQARTETDLPEETVQEEKESVQQEPLLLNWFKEKDEPDQEKKEIVAVQEDNTNVHDMDQEPKEDSAATRSTAEQISKQLLKASKEMSKPVQQEARPEEVAQEEIQPVTIRCSSRKSKKNDDAPEENKKHKSIRANKRFIPGEKPEQEPIAPVADKSIEAIKHVSGVPKMKNSDAEEKKLRVEKPKAQTNTSKPGSGKPVAVSKSKPTKRKPLRFPIKTVSLFFAVFAIMVGVAYGLNTVFPFFSDNDTQEVNNNISDSMNNHDISVEGKNGSKIETTQPGETDKKPVETTQKPAETTKPVETTTTQPAETTGTPSKSGVTEYVVKAGDFLRKISKDFYGTEDYYNVIVEYNNLTGTELTVGQKLYLPPLVDDQGVKYELYVVQPGDYLIQISRKVYNDGNLYSVIMKYNNIGEKDEIVVGQILKIPTDPNYNQ